MVKYKKLLTQEVIHADETVVQVLREKNRKPTTESGMGVHRGVHRGSSPEGISMILPLILITK